MGERIRRLKVGKLVDWDKPQLWGLNFSELSLTFRSVKDLLALARESCWISGFSVKEKALFAEAVFNL